MLIEVKRGPKRNHDLHIIVNCAGCGILIDVFKSLYKQNKTKKFYHNKQCFLKYSDFKGSEKIINASNTNT